MSATEILTAGCMSIPDGVEFTGLSRSFLYAEMEAGRLPYVIRGGIDGRGGRRLLPKAALVEYLKEGLRGGPDRVTAVGA